MNIESNVTEDKTLTPNKADISAHLYALFDAAFVHKHPEAWIEIAYARPDGKPTQALRDCGDSFTRSRRGAQLIIFRADYALRFGTLAHFFATTNLTFRIAVAYTKTRTRMRLHPFRALRKTIKSVCSNPGVGI